MKIDILGKRVKKLRKMLVQKGLDALLITGGADVSYLSGFKGDDSMLVLGKKDVWLVTDSRYTLQAKEECRGCKIYERKGAMTEAIADVLKKIQAIKTIAVEDNIKLSSFNLLKKKIHCRIKPVRNFVLTVRQIKDDAEIRAIKKAAALAQESLNKILPKIRAGISEVEVAAILEFEMKRRGAVPAFETIVAFGNNSAKPHHRPTARKLKKIDTVLIDYGAKLGSYCSDSTRCFAVGRVSDFYTKVYKTVFEAQKAAIKAIKAGVQAKDADNIAKEIINESKLPPYGHGLGHGVGLEVHERPVVSVLSKDILQKGNVITIEPAVYLAGKFGIRIEDDVVITEKGCEILTTLLKSDKVPLLKI
ncbi:MAG: Xaa-Pro peptidase family protein [Sedimentisphaerales bacterium]